MLFVELTLYRNMKSGSLPCTIECQQNCSWVCDAESALPVLYGQRHVHTNAVADHCACRVLQFKQDTHRQKTTAAVLALLYRR